MTLFPRLPIRAVAAAVLAVAGLALAPGGAAASCGDYVQIISDPQPDAKPAAPVVPCHGPGCSKAPATPILPLTAPIGSPSQSDQSVALEDLTDGASPDSGWTRSMGTSPQPIRLTSSIFHPPRAG